MKPLNHNSLGVILTLGIPTTVILIGLLWLLRRSRDEDDESGDDAAGTVKSKSSTDAPSEEEKDLTCQAQECSDMTWKPELTGKVIQDSGDATTQGKDITTSKERSAPDLKTDTQPILKPSVVDCKQSELRSDLAAQNSILLESNSTNLATVTLQSGDFQAVQELPHAEEMVAEKLLVTSQELLESSVVSDATSSEDSSTMSRDSLEPSLQSECTLPNQASAASNETGTVTVTSSGSSANSLQPRSPCSLQSDSSGMDRVVKEMSNDRVVEEMSKQVSSSVCFSLAQSSGVSSRSGSIPVVGHSDGCHLITAEDSEASLQEHPPVQEVVHESVSKKCEAEHSAPLQGLTCSDTPTSGPKPSNSNEKSDPSDKSPAKDTTCEVKDECSLQSVTGVLEQSVDSCLGSEESTLSISENKLHSAAEVSEEAGSVVHEEGGNSDVCHGQTTEFSRLASLPDIPADTGSSLFKNACSTSENSVDIKASTSMPVSNTESTEATASNFTSVSLESVSVSLPDDTSENEQNTSKAGPALAESNEFDKAEAKDSNEKSESNNKETSHEVDAKMNRNIPGASSDNIGNEGSSLKQAAHKSSNSATMTPDSGDSSVSYSRTATVKEASSARTENNIGNVSGQKTDSKHTSKISKKQKSDSSPLKSTQSHSKSSPPSSKPKQSSTKPASPSVSSPRTANDNNNRGKNQSAMRDGVSEFDDVSKTSSSVSENGRMDSGSPVCDTNSEASNDSGRGGSVGDTLIPLPAGELMRYDFNFPSDLCGRLIGRGGKNIQYIKNQSGATVTLSSNPFTPEFQICHVQGMQAEVDRALMMIRKKFPLSHYPRLDMAPLTPSTPAPVVLPEVMQLSLPEGVSIDVVVSAVVNAGHIFIQQPTHPSFPSLERLNHVMNVCYGDTSVPSLPRPVEGGIICASESEGQWYRAQVVQVYPMEDECDIKYVDYGGYTKVPINTLKQIRSDFMTLPFQAVECYLANITPLQGGECLDLVFDVIRVSHRTYQRTGSLPCRNACEEEYFSEKAADVLMELTSGQMLQGQVVGRGDDSVGYVHLYRVSGHKVLMINREMVNREVVRWIEIL